MPNPLHLPGPRKTPFSHERILEICYAYKRLREHVRNVQAQIDEALDEFAHSTHSAQSLSQMVTKLATIDGNVGAALQNDILTIELELVNWETRSAKLRSEAKRQARRRAERNDRGANAVGRPYLLGSNASDLDEFEPAGDESPSETPSETPDEAPQGETPATMSPTMALAMRGMQQLGEVDKETTSAIKVATAAEKFIRDHAVGVQSELKKSGLV